MRTIINILLFSGIAAALWIKYFPEKKEVHITVMETLDRSDRTEQIKQAINELEAACPAVKRAQNIEVTYENEEQMLWRAEKLGWKSDFYFKVDDLNGTSGNVHNFYIRQDGVNELLVDGKQISLDWCGINGKMNNYFIVPI